MEEGKLVRKRAQPEPAAERGLMSLDQDAQSPEPESRQGRACDKIDARHLEEPSKIAGRGQCGDTPIKPLDAWQALDGQEERYGDKGEHHE